MVSNYDSIYLEITRHADLIQSKHGVSAHDLTTLVMEIVNLEDRNRIKPLPAINKPITNMIEQAAKTHAQKRNETPC